MSNAADFNQRKRVLEERFQAAGGDPRELQGFMEGATWEEQLRWMETKVEEQESKQRPT